MTTDVQTAQASGAEFGVIFDAALHAALQRWQLETGRTLRHWLEGHCTGFAETLAGFLGKPACLASVLASDGNVHHVVVMLGDLVIDARGVNTSESLIAQINREATACGSSLKALAVIPFQREHAELLKEPSKSQLRMLRGCISTPAMRRVRREARRLAAKRAAPRQRIRVHALLAAKVAYMMGRKFEEGDWAEVYCKAKGIPVRGWSNLNIDIMHEGLGVEHKMLCYRSDADLAEAFGQTFMHPAATRSIRVPPTNISAEKAMREIFQQYAALIQQRTKKVRETAPKGKESDMRTGWLLWQESLRQFLYFEEPMSAPDPKYFYAEWHDSGGGARKASRNLWVFDKATGHKRYSITTSAGAKIQPYFDVPPPNDPNVYLFTVIGEVIGVGLVRVWLTLATFRELKRVLGEFDTAKLSDFVLRKLEGVSASLTVREGNEPAAESVVLTADAYLKLKAVFPGVNDDNSFQLFLEFLGK